MSIDSQKGILNEAQEAVLRWIGDGCPDGVYEGYSHRVSAAALRTRGLVHIQGRGANWRAELTATGAAYQNRLKTSPPLVEPAALPPATQSAKPAPKPKPKPKPRRVGPTEQLMRDLVAAGGVLRVPRWRNQGDPDYGQLVRAAELWDKVPGGKRIETEWVEGGQTEIRLVDAPEGSVIEAKPVSVPARLTKPHPVARQYRGDTAHHRVSRASLSRCARIIHALATECERRGYEMKNGRREPKTDNRRAGRASDRADFTIQVRGHSYPLNLSEEKVPERGAWEGQERLRKTDYYTRQLGIEPRIGRYDKEGTGRLTITLASGYSRHGRPSTWADRRSWKLEDKLPDLLREIEMRVVEDEHREAEERRQEEERQRQWEAAMERAKAQFVEAHRAEMLTSQIERWQQATLATAYLEALEAAHGDDPDAAEWIAWARSYVERLDPLSVAPRMPEVPEPKPDGLKPFLGGLSPYGPRGW